MVRLLHVGLGALGRRVLQDFFARGMGTVVAALDLDPALAGVPLSELVPGAPDTLLVTADLEAAARESVDACLVTTRSDVEGCADTFRTLLGRGHTIVSSCEELLWPWLRNPILAQELHERAVRGRGRLLGTGVNPGWLMDALPVAASSVCTRVDSIEIERIQDATPRRLQFQSKIGATLDLETFRAREKDGSLRHVGLLESLHFVAHYLDLGLASWDETLEPVIADRALECGLGPVRVGDAAGVRQVAEGRNGAGEVVARLVFQAAIGQPDPHDSVRITGEPPIDLVLRGGVHGDVATSAMLLNTIAPLRTVEPGLHTMASIPPAPCRRPARR